MNEALDVPELFDWKTWTSKVSCASKYTEIDTVPESLSNTEWLITPS